MVIRKPSAKAKPRLPPIKMLLPRKHNLLNLKVLSALLDGLYSSIQTVNGHGFGYYINLMINVEKSCPFRQYVYVDLVLINRNDWDMAEGRNNPKNINFINFRWQMANKHMASFRAIYSS